MIDLSLCLVTDPVSTRGRGLLKLVDQALAGGVTSVQVRDKQADTAALLELVMGVANLANGRATVLVNDRVDVFLAARAAGAAVHGVHLGQTDLPACWARKLVRPAAPLRGATDGASQPVLGLTAHTHEQVAAAAMLPAGTVDYLGVGVIHPTPTKTDPPPLLGVFGFARLAAATHLPCVAIGGIQATDVGPLRRAGAAGVAVSSYVLRAADPAAAARTLRRAWREACA